MLRVRFHGRGGHGIKTASRILGTAGFLGGMQAQDSPLYGAERRGAAIVAFTRLDREPILERGIIPNPDVIIVADHTLLADPVAGVASGQKAASVMFVNSALSKEEIASQFSLTCPVVSQDLTTRTLDALGRSSALSAPVGAAACALTGVISASHLEDAVREELSELPLAHEVIEKNMLLARQVYDGTPRVKLRGPQEARPSVEMHKPAYVRMPQGAPVIFHTGNATQRHTGSWRIFRPVIDRDICTRCQICLVRCPDSAISLDAEGYPVIDYDNCKGCMICQQECPVHGIEEHKEVEAW